MINRRLLLICLTVLALTGCRTPRSTRVDADARADEPALTSTFISEVPVEEVHAAVLQALRNREWKITSRAPEALEAFLIHRGYESRIRIPISPTGIEIYSDSWLLDGDGRRRNRAHPAGWFRNIERDVRRYLAQPL